MGKIKERVVELAPVSRISAVGGRRIGSMCDAREAKGGLDLV